MPRANPVILAAAVIPCFVVLSMNPQTPSAPPITCHARATTLAATGASPASEEHPPEERVEKAPPSGKTGDARAGGASSSSGVPFGRATDPETGDGPCANYSLDGVALGMTQSEVQKAQALRSVPPSDSRIPGFEDGIFSFRARRWGRVDDVQVGFQTDRKTPRVRYLSARIVVGRSDSWPKSLISALGSPKRARSGEWIFWDLACGVTLRLAKTPSIGPGEADHYLLEMEPTHTPNPSSDSKAPASSQTPETKTPDATQTKP